MSEKNKNITLDLFLRNTISFYNSIFLLVLKGLKKYWKTALLSLIVFVLLFGLKYSNTNTYYKSKTSYTFNYINKKLYGDLLLDIDKLAETKEYATLSKKLNISDKTAKNLLKLKAKNIVGSPLHEDFTEMKVPFYIDIEILDKNEIFVLQTAITNYLTQNRFIVKHIKNKHLELKQRLTLVESNILKINTLKSNIENNEAEKLTELVRLSEEKLIEKIKISKQLSTTKSVTLLKGFQSIKISKKSQIIKSAIKYGVSFVVLTLLITTFMFWFKNVKDES